MKKTVLVVDDEPDLLELVAHHLESAGFEVLRASGGLEGLELASRTPPDAILLDVMLPDLLGTEVFKRLRRDPATAAVPVVFLTARGDEVDRVVGFELGADDYVVKPFSPRELVLRIQALLRRSEAVAEPAGPVLERGGIRLDQTRHEAAARGQLLDLTPIEFKLLTHLMERPGRVLTRDQLLESVWGSDVFVTERTVDTHIKRLRSKLGRTADRIETIRGVGYRFRE
jgi:two-component system, OmpR family, phosphate regulon response regulator PhoB